MVPGIGSGSQSGGVALPFLTCQAGVGIPEAGAGGEGSRPGSSRPGEGQGAPHSGDKLFRVPCRSRASVGGRDGNPGTGGKTGRYSHIGKHLREINSRHVWLQRHQVEKLKLTKQGSQGRGEARMSLTRLTEGFPEMQRL